MTGEVERIYKVGDKVWWFNGRLIVKCTITEVDDQYRKSHPSGTIFYGLDEPVGHLVANDELYDTLEEAIAVEGDDTRDVIEVPGVGERVVTLEQCRINAARFTLATHLLGADYGKQAKISDEMVQKALKEWGYPAKKRGEEWFAYGDIEDRKEKR